MPKETKPEKMKTEQNIPLEELEIGSVIYQTRLTSKFRNRKGWQRPDEKKVLAFIPGTIQKIMVKEGQEVDQGMPILILEAMKMRNELTSPVHGIVKRIYVAEGDMIPKGHLIMEFQ